ncbi:glycoside hydrolase family 43 [Rhodoferax koreense]|uniref:Glycoside hydrolase family 43 n=1 Tax=Rhodoferax koreensis TaxID=1842727 RepID=A0A1P8K3J4_9BURK|nr:glycoside hydrolase family 43 [Rhodoferax koreense]
MPIAAVLLAAGVWWRLAPEPSLAGVVGGNGRLEAVEIDIAAKTAGRLKTVRVHEGDMVSAGQVVAELATETLDAELARARAQVAQAVHARQTAEAQVALRLQAEQTALATVAQRQSQLALAERDMQRTRELVDQQFLAPQKLDEARAQNDGARAVLAAALSQVAEARQAIAAARAQAVEAEASIDAARAGVLSLQASLDDSVLRAPRNARVQVRAAEEGEIVAAGTRILSLVDLSDVTMNFFLPEVAAGRTPIGAEVRIVLDAAPQWAIPARVSFIASVAQFTPKTVETLDERNKMVFRVRARIDPALLARYGAQVKTGLPGMAYVRTDPALPWPARLQTSLPAAPAEGASP